ncbi:head GIN domain-containing protein [Mariniflexile soesokkakense]|uniref:Head GIN domain-containing protein n=1 Tax=Mariniflexile soesokkakense TaxID=1343160 RepID=A0ABV0AA86_9FLAO
MRTLIIVLAVLLTLNSNAQKKQKIKGNREVIEVYDNLNAFNEIEIADDLEVNIMQTLSEGYRLKADSNLISSIKFEVVDSVLKIYTSNKITSSKSLEIYVTCKELNKITLKNDAELNGQNNINGTDLTLLCLDNSEFDLDINSTMFSLQLNSSTKGKLNLKSVTSTMALNDNSSLKASLSIDDFDLILSKKADMNIEGNCDNLNLITSGSVNVKAKNLLVTNAKINASNSSDIYVYASKYLSLYAKDRSYVYVYGSPEINVEGLNDKSQIIKK